MSQVALIIIYNHRYDKNIPIVENIYKGRFDHIYHLVPFYDGDRPNVIPVYENSRQFQGYISQGMRSFFDKRFNHYFFVADDMVLNPAIDQNNYASYFGVENGGNFLPGFIPLHKMDFFWSHLEDAVRYTTKVQGVEAVGEVPSREEAMLRFAACGLKVRPVHYNPLRQGIPLSLGNLRSASYMMWREFRKSLKTIFKFKNQFYLDYPLVGSYSDICIISGEAMGRFSHYCGVFAATGLFVELALPTALVLATDKITTENQLQMRGIKLWSPREIEAQLGRYNNSYSALEAGFPADGLYIHPVKLSKWKFQ